MAPCRKAFICMNPLPPAHPLLAGDCRDLAIGAGQGQLGANAPARLIYVVDLEKFKTAGSPNPACMMPRSRNPILR